MSRFGEDLIQSLEETVAFLDGKGPGTLDYYVVPRDIRENADLTQEQMASLLGMKLADYQAWESRLQRLEGAVGNMLQMLDKEPDVVKRTLLAAS